MSELERTTDGSPELEGTLERGAAAKPSWLGTGLLFALALAFHAWLQFRRDVLHGTDGYFHIKLARLISTGEVSILGGEFPWMAYGTYGRLGADWQLGYHLLLVPFTWFGLILGAKISAAIFAALIPAVVHRILRLHGVPLAWLFAILTCLTAENHLARAHLVRPTTLVVLLLLVVAHLASTRSYRALFVATLGLLAVYDVPHNAIAVIGMAGLAMVALEGRLPWRLGFTGLGAVVVATVAHPGFWHWEGSFFGPDHGLLRIWSQMSGALAGSVAGNVLPYGEGFIPYPAPGEFRAPSGRLILDDFGAPLIVFGAALALVAIPGRRRVTPFVVTTLGMSVLYFVLFLGHQRFFEYWIPFAVLAAGAGFGRVVGPRLGEWLRGLGQRPKIQATVWSALALVPLAAALWLGGHAVQRASVTLASSTGGGIQYEGAMTWLRENTEEDELVFHGQWPQFSAMFFFNHWNRYVIGLDPYFFYQDDPDSYLLWYRAGAGELAPAQTTAVIRKLGARFAFCRLNSDLGKRLSAAPDAELAYGGERWGVYRIAGS